MQPVVAWLVARPQNAVLALAVALLLPLSQFFSGVIMVLLVLRDGVRVATIKGLIAAGILALFGLVLGASVLQIVFSVIVTLVPSMLFAMLLRAMRSLTLSLQVSVIVATLVVLALHIGIADPLAFWQPVLLLMGETWRELGFQELADALLSEPASVVEQMPMLIVLSAWFLYSAVLLLGYLLYRQLPVENEDFGQFRNLSFGRVIAVTMALVSLLAVVTSAVWVQNVAVLLFVVFWLQGLAIVHWMHAEKLLPHIGVIAVYALMPILNVMLVAALAVLGYTDAWFRYRRRRQTR